MLKINALRDFLVAAMPELAADPAALRMWVDRGTVASTLSATASFAFRFRLNVLLIDFAGDIAQLALAIVIWLRTHQPDLLTGTADAFEFEADFLDAEKADLLFQINLRQNVSAVPGAQGITARYLPEPDPLFADDAPILGLPDAPLLSAIVMEGEGKIAPGLADG